MTKEEAIHILRDSKPSTIMKEGKVFERVADVCIAIDMAIESLKHTPCYLDSPCEYQNPDIKMPLPKGHGTLVEGKEVLRKIYELRQRTSIFSNNDTMAVLDELIRFVDFMPVIVGADEEGAEE